MQHIDQGDGACRAADVVSGSAPVAGRVRWFLNTRASIDVPGVATGGALDVVTQLLPAGYSPPAHLHRHRDEVLWVVSGELDVVCGRVLHSLGAGAVLHVPRGVVHALTVSLSAAAEVVVCSVPAGYAGLVAEVGTAAVGPGLPPPSVPDLEGLAASGRRHDFVLSDDDGDTSPA